MNKPSHEYCKECEDWNGNIGNCMEICYTPINIIEEWEKYHALGTLEELQKAIEKQRAKKQRSIDDSESHFRLSKAGFLCCCVTNKDIRYPLISLRDLDYCPRCGQAIDWREEE